MIFVMENTPESGGWTVVTLGGERDGVVVYLESGQATTSSSCRVIVRFCVDLSDAAIGRGAFSEVRRGLDVLTGEAVAIKTYMVIGVRTSSTRASRTMRIW